ncbi:MAG: hypothetical protein AAF518_02045 [Spirochaetota bacterium]
MTDTPILEKVSSYLSDQKRIAHSLERIVDWTFAAKLEDILLDPKIIAEQSLLHSIPSQSNLFPILKELEIDSLYPYSTLADGMEEETLQALLALAEEVELKPSQAFIRKVVSQDAIKDLLSNIIESTIIEFNKKLNPLFGAMQMAGMDKQIKNFINLFLPTLLPKVAEFVYNTTLNNGKNNLERELLKTIVTAHLDELNLQQSIDFGTAKTTLGNLKQRIAADETLHNTFLQVQQELRKRLLDQHGKKTLKEFTGFQEEDFQVFKTTYTQKTAEVIFTFNQKNHVEKLFSEIIEDILA